MKKQERKVAIGEDEISISRFVQEYLGVENVNCKNLYHRGLKSFESPLVIGISNDTAEKFPDLVATGEILKVRDARGHLGTYLNPNIIIGYANNLENKEQLEKTLKKIRINEFKKLQELYNEAKKLQYTINKIDSCLNLIKSVSKTDEEENGRIMKMESNAKTIIKIKKIIDK